MRSKVHQLMDLAATRGVIRPKDLAPLGIPRSYLARLCRRGILTRIGRGLYEFSGAEVTEHHSLVEAAKRVPHGVICLLSALQYHRLGTQAPFEIWMAIGSTARKPRVDHLQLRVVRMSGQAAAAGIEDHIIEGTPIKIYSAAKTVADCFKYRNKIGLEVALDALREFRRTHRGEIDELWEFAGICRVTNVMRPYLESLA